MIRSQIPAKLFATVPPKRTPEQGRVHERILLLDLDPETVFLTLHCRQV
jgi:hypothetical protein